MCGAEGEDLGDEFALRGGEDGVGGFVGGGVVVRGCGVEEGGGEGGAEVLEEGAVGGVEFDGGVGVGRVGEGLLEGVGGEGGAAKLLLDLRGDLRHLVVDLLRGEDAGDEDVVADGVADEEKRDGDAGGEPGDDPVITAGGA